MGINDVVVELSYGSTESELIKEMMDEALEEMLRYDSGNVISHDKETGCLKVRLGCFHDRRWESFGYRVVKATEATGYTGRDGVYHPPEDLTWLVG